MPVIISATDFSEVARNATHYACNMALQYNASLTLLHSYIIPVSFTDNPMPIMPIDEGREIAETQMNELVKELNLAYPTLLINGEVTYGLITDSLTEYTERIKPWMVVIGNSSSTEGNFWAMGNLLNEVRHVPGTIAAISEHTTFQPINNICFATDFKHVEENLPFNEIIDLVNKTGALLHVLNVDWENKHFGTAEIEESTLLHTGLRDVNPQYHYIQDEKTEHGISQFVTEAGIDWLLLAPHKHNFLEKLFSKSHTKQILEQVQIPILTLHEK